jgi:hypothetical protein
VHPDAHQAADGTLVKASFSIGAIALCPTDKSCDGESLWASGDATVRVSSRAAGDPK